MIRWTDYLRYRLELRRFDRDRVEEIVRFSEERYFDTATGRLVVVGRHRASLIMIPYEIEPGGDVVPVTVHVTSREQINLRVRSGRLRHE